MAPLCQSSALRAIAHQHQRGVARWRRSNSKRQHSGGRSVSNKTACALALPHKHRILFSRLPPASCAARAAWRLAPRNSITSTRHSGSVNHSAWRRSGMRKTDGVASYQTGGGVSVAGSRKTYHGVTNNRA